MLLEFVSQTSGGRGVNAATKFFEKLNQLRSGRTKAVRPTVGSEATRPKAVIQQRLFHEDSPTPEPIPSAEEQWYQRTCDELPPEQRDRFIRLVQQSAKG